MKTPALPGLFVVFAAALVVSSCDAHRFYNFKVLPYSRNESGLLVFADKHDGRAKAIALTVRVAKRHDMEIDKDGVKCRVEWCMTFRQPSSGIRLLVFEAIDGTIQFELQEFGPVFATQRFKVIKHDLVEESEIMFGADAVRVIE